MLLPPPGNPRILVFTALVNTFGNGAYLTVSVLFLTGSVGLTPAEVATGLSVAALCGMVFSAPMGSLSDRIGPKGVQIGAMLVLAVCYGGLVLVDGLWSFIVLASVIAMGEATVKTANGAFVAGAVAPDQRLRLRAYLRSANNAGVGLGALAGGLPLLLDSRDGYVAVLVGNAVTSVVAAAILSRATATRPVATPAGASRLAAFRDGSFLSFAAMDGLMQALYNAMITLALPLWLVTRSHGPVWLVSAALLINTLGCVLLQVWASRGADGLPRAARVGRRGALVVAASCVLFGLTADLPTWAVAALVLVAAAVHVMGELWLSTATWSVVYGMAPDWAQGQYQGTYLTGRQIGNMLSPPLLTVLIVGVGEPGWLLIGLIFALGGIGYPAVVNWGQRTRPARPAVAGQLA